MRACPEPNECTAKRTVACLERHGATSRPLSLSFFAFSRSLLLHTSIPTSTSASPTHTHARTHARTRAHTHTPHMYISLFNIPWSSSRQIKEPAQQGTSGEARPVSMPLVSSDSGAGGAKHTHTHSQSPLHAHSLSHSRSSSTSPCRLVCVCVCVCVRVCVSDGLETVQRCDILRKSERWAGGIASARNITLLRAYSL